MATAEERYTYSTTTAIGARRKSAQQRALFRFFLPELPQGAMVAEIGPGRGEFARECLARGLEYVGVEPSAELTTQLRQAGFTILNEVIPPLPFDADSTSLVHSADFVEHLLDYQRVMEFFAETFRVLRPGGYVSVVAPNYSTIRDLYFQYEYQHTFIVTKYRLQQMLRDCGFEVVVARCFLATLSPRLHWADRLAAHTALPILLNSFVQTVIRTVGSEDLLFRINKNLFDHVAILGRKPIVPATGTEA